MKEFVFSFYLIFKFLFWIKIYHSKSSQVVGKFSVVINRGLIWNWNISGLKIGIILSQVSISELNWSRWTNVYTCISDQVLVINWIWVNRCVNFFLVSISCNDVLQLWVRVISLSECLLCLIHDSFLFLNMSNSHFFMLDFVLVVISHLSIESFDFFRKWSVHQFKVLIFRSKSISLGLERKFKVSSFISQLSYFESKWFKFI